MARILELAGNVESTPGTLEDEMIAESGKEEDARQDPTEFIGPKEWVGHYMERRNRQEEAGEEETEAPSSEDMNDSSASWGTQSPGTVKAPLFLFSCSVLAYGICKLV